jgi:hypothetical protein
MKFNNKNAAAQGLFKKGKQTCGYYMKGFPGFSLLFMRRRPEWL